jgi:uncharacterized protein YndB with AHSA1/START domain
MQAFTLETTVARPRELVFDYLADVSHHPEFLDHFLHDWHMTREETFGIGAGGRFRAQVPFQRFPWGDWTIVQLEAPHRIVLQGRAGKFNRILTLTVFELRDAANGGTGVRVTVDSRPRFPSDRLLDGLGRRAVRRRWRAALSRLRRILEEDRDRGTRATIAGGPRKPATSTRPPVTHV